MNKLEQKIQELKLRAQPINYSNVSVNERGLITGPSLLDQRIIEGYLIVWGQVNMFDEMVIKGACAKSIADRGPKSNAQYKITFLWMHHMDDPLSLFAELIEDDFGLRFKTKPLDDVPNADRALKQIRSGTLNQFSVGFDYVWDKVEYDEKNDCLVLLEIDLFEGSIVTIGADCETFAIRSKEDILNLHDDTDEFIKTLPRKLQFEARQLFARHKSLMDLEPLEQRKKALNEHEPTKNGIDYNYLLTNL